MASGPIILILWGVWLAVWIAMARGVKPAAARESNASRLAHVLPLAVAIYLIGAPHVPVPLLEARFAPLEIALARLGVALTFAGLAFAVWARVWLAGNWSGGVTFKLDHELVAGGPYRWVRHPIYAGLIVALAGTALAVGEWRAALGVVIAIAALWRKLRREEALMRERFGDAYDRYAERVCALIPFLL